MSSDKPCILVTNDDGYDAPGLHALTEALEPLGRIIVAAPDQEQSAQAHALTVSRPLRVYQVATDRYRIDGTPTDCVHLAVERLTGGRLPDLVASGINRGLNIGDDLTYSGTVAGALEGALLHIPALAFSSQTDHEGRADWGPVSAFARKISADVLERGLEPGVLLNVNVPVRPPKGVRITRQGTRTYRATTLERLDPSGRPYYWVGGADVKPADEADGDHVASRDDYISVTPLHANLTHEPYLETLSGWSMELPES
ncbi:MAG: 5'/3'-nucleotidase SurE [Planctomycetota bacterium]|jgi:5'-nucleotidase